MRPLLVLAHLTLLPLCAWALLEMLDGARRRQRIAIWLIACVVVHDLVRAAAVLGRRPRPAAGGGRRAINYVRVPGGRCRC